MLVTKKVLIGLKKNRLSAQMENFAPYFFQRSLTTKGQTGGTITVTLLLHPLKDRLKNVHA